MAFERNGRILPLEARLWSWTALHRALSYDEVLHYRILHGGSWNTCVELEMSLMVR